MGYYTRHSLTIERYDAPEGCGHSVPDGSKFCPECGTNLSLPFSIDQAVIDFSETVMDGYSMESLLAGDNDLWKWYDHEIHMKKISAAFPGYLFTLEGEGEEAGDIWKSYYLNGKCQNEQAKIVFADFDESKLQ